MKLELPKLNKKVISTGSVFDEEEEKKYWQTKTQNDRITAIEYNRRLIYGQDRAASRLQRFLETAPFP
jgi:hypothetical protein